MQSANFSGFSRGNFYLQRLLRDFKALLTYPIWLLRHKPAPDNALHKRSRLRLVSRQYNCDTLIETGTFYGQTLHSLRGHFQKLLSVELSPQLFRMNQAAFSRFPQVTIFFGDSSAELERMIAAAEGKIVFWLDGHYSGDGTACGAAESPILSELEIIRKCGRTGDCILIDDARLFTGRSGYPTLAQTFDKLRELGDYRIAVEGDCIIAVTERP